MRTIGLGVCCLALAGCNTITVQEAKLSNNQTVAMVSTPGDGVTPPTNMVLIKDRTGRFVPVSTGYGQAVVPAVLAGAVSGVAVAGGMYAGGRAIRPSQITQTQGQGQSTSAAAAAATGTNPVATAIAF